MAKWVEPYQEMGVAGLGDRSSRPRRLRPSTPAATLELVESLRCQRWPSDRVIGDPRDTVRGIGAEAVHVAILACPERSRRDRTRIAISHIFPDETVASVIVFLEAALRFCARLGIHIRALLTDNGGAYCSRRFALACRRLGLKHRRTRPTPAHQRKAERFLQTALREWAYVRTYQNSAERETYLAPWIHQYDWHQPHSSLGRPHPSLEQASSRTTS